MHDTRDLENQSNLRRGVLEFCVLLAISREKRVYASDIIKTLADADFPVIEGTLYPLLNRLRREGQLEHTWEESRTGPPRKYYALTSAGKENLMKTKTVWESITRTILNLQNHA